MDTPSFEAPEYESIVIKHKTKGFVHYELLALCPSVEFAFIAEDLPTAKRALVDYVEQSNARPILTDFEFLFYWGARALEEHEYAAQLREMRS